MDLVRREQLISNICAKRIPGNINGTMLLFGTPTPYHKMISNQIYQDWYQTGIKSGLLNEEELEILSYSHDIWDSHWESTLEELKSDIEKLKVGLCGSFFRSNEQKTIKKNLRSAKHKYINLTTQKNSLHENTAEFLAQMIKGLYLSCCEVYLPNGELFIDPEEILHSNDLNLSRILDFRQSQVLDETVIRELARTEPWRSIWTTCKEAHIIFGCSPTELSPSQQYITIWSTVYDNVNESMDCPSDDIISDDDALDGWFILQKRKRDKDNNQKQIDALTGNSKINQADEVFIQADTPDDARKIYEMNDPVARGKLLKRQRLVESKGRVKEVDMPDTRLKLKMAAQQQYAAQIKNNKG